MRKARDVLALSRRRHRDGWRHAAARAGARHHLL